MLNPTLLYWHQLWTLFSPKWSCSSWEWTPKQYNMYNLLYSHDNTGVILHNGVVQVESSEVHDCCTLQRWDTYGSHIVLWHSGHTGAMWWRWAESTYHHRLGHRRLKGVAEIQQPPLVVSKQNVFLMTLQEHGFTHSRLRTERSKKTR